jgi:hypothetical protein
MFDVLIESMYDTNKIFLYSRALHQRLKFFGTRLVFNSGPTLALLRY